MDNSFVVVISLIVGAVNYLIKIVPFAFLKKKLKSRFIKSFLHYVPFAVMATIAIPGIFSSTSSIWSATFGLVVAIILGLLDQNLLVISLASVVGVYVFERILNV